uniref:Knottin scorpion toxin-like domain-containing protein n=1 Tax=Aegilops tauschii subsp. strangulata TaxID=200361 RepID=A0A453GZK1_AEGTS
MVLMKNSVQAMCLVALVIMSTVLLPSHVEGRIMDTKERSLTLCFLWKRCTIDLCRQNCSARGYAKSESTCDSYKDNKYCCCATD